MPVNFDEIAEKEDRDFIIRGQTFTVQRVSPGVMDQIDSIQEHFAALEDPTYSQLADYFNQRIKLLIDNGNGAVEKWDELMEGGDIPYTDLSAISRTAFEIATGFPTMPASGSAGGAAAAGGSSKAG